MSNQDRIPTTLIPSHFRNYFSDIDYDVLNRQYDRDIMPEPAVANNGKKYMVSSGRNRYGDRVIKLKSIKN